MNKKVCYLCLTDCLLYFISTILMIIIGKTFFISLMEIITIVSSIVLLIFFLTLPDEQCVFAKKLAIIFISCTMVLTSIAHTTNIAFINPLIKEGVNIPEYLQIGKWPSIIMTIDYLGWGLFMGLCFISSSYTIKKENKIFKYTLFINGVFCILGLIGTIAIDENLWYIAPIGYGIGSTVMCIELLYKKSK